MEEEFENVEYVNYKLASELKALGFNYPCFRAYDNCEMLYYSSSSNGNILNSNLSTAVAAPLYQQAFKFMRKVYGLYVHSVPEFYYTGINFNWQILWYSPKNEWSKHNCNDGTFLYGDNGEYPTQELADIAMIEKMIELVKSKKVINLVNSLKR